MKTHPGRVYAPYLPGKVKKKLVFTARVKRLLFCIALLNICGGVLISVFMNPWAMFLLLILEPCLLLVAAWIMTPVEKAVQKHYINDAARMLKDAPKLEIIGVTGSFGKTSVKFILQELMSVKYDTLMTPESYNTTMGVVRTIRERLRPNHRYFICEMGARNKGDVKEICDLVHPATGVITALGPQHLESFGSLDVTAASKHELFDAVPEGGRKYVNWDNELIRKYYGNEKGLVKYGFTEECDYRVFDVSAGSSGTRFRVTGPDGEEAEFTTALLGRHSALNIAGAAAVANGYGVSLKEMRSAVRMLKSVPHRLELVRRNGISIIDDAYNSNPQGCRMALDTLSLFTDDLKIIVTPGMVELGDRQYEENELLGREAAEVCDYIVAVGRKQAEPIRAGAMAAGFPEDRLYTAEDLKDAMSYVYALQGGRSKAVLLENDLTDNY
ncbi:MAG: UDP-N-acetylmuramoyl-tripeptide--D-alanyl-D-alanine ligase [Lachnospiraceae bacterium]|nr:UDP-N-acetylmuramoyl-tripeptide--D-alanyl-D-alanine ligase [Lachnospiraceae bacterium]